MNIPENLKYTKDHEWLRVEGEYAYIGITDYAQSQFGDIAYVDIETEGEVLEKEETLGTIEAVKTVAEVFMPVGGEVLEFNTLVQDDSSIINSDPYGDGWLVKIKITDPSELDCLLDAKAYSEIIDE
ncbi:MAG: glycine cleavage system protein GcvH [Bacteroidales bacterium]|jgi:glycine cleavage system H protein